ncbi:MAG TPA: hypothetical protein VLX32_03570 [Candidatus Acidoferrum sp.]|nr:hypothetical protein [Candidatus Acidoferrum sp.]
MKKAALGFRVHSGWTSLVAIALDKGSPIVLLRQRPHLVETFSYTFRQPYHTAEKMEIGEARQFLLGARDEARKLAYDSIRAAMVEAKQLGFEVTRSALLLASGRPLPELEKILAAHSLIHTADGELFREALLHASERSKLHVTLLKERELLTTAAKILRKRPEAILRQALRMGKEVGSPWTQDEKFATLAAWISLAD